MSNFNDFLKKINVPIKDEAEKPDIDFLKLRIKELEEAEGIKIEEEDNAANT